MNCRETGFWFIDAMKGGPVKKAYNELKQNETGENREKLTKKLIAHAIKTVPAYMTLANTDFYNMPVKYKKDYKNNLQWMQNAASGWRSGSKRGQLVFLQKSIQP